MEPQRIEAVPQMIGGYRIDAILGRGGSATVYRAHDPALDRTVALKLLAHDLDEEGRARFELEARALSRINHPNVVQVFSSGQHEGRAFITEELVEGCSLSEILEVRGALQPALVVELGAQLAAGLATTAEAGVLHRDVKPENVLVRDDGTAKLTDFGVARLIGAPSRLTEQGTTLGTPHYMSPEQGQGLELDARSDQYSLGATLYHLLTGAPPFHSENVLALLLKHLQCPLVPIREHTPDCPPRLASIVERMLEKSAERRFSSFAEVEEALASVEDDPETVIELPPQDPPRAPEAPAGRERRPLVALLREESPLIAAAMTLAAAVIVSSGTLWPAKPRPAPLVAPKTEASIIAPVLPRAASSPAPEAAPAEPEGRAVAKKGGALRGPKIDTELRALSAARALAATHDAGATAALLELVLHARVEVAVAAAQTLAELGDVDALAPLEEIARSGAAPEVRAAARRAHERLFKVEE